MSSWGLGSSELEPLFSSKVEELEIPYGRIIVITPEAESARAKYVFDRVVGTLRQTGIAVEEVAL